MKISLLIITTDVTYAKLLSDNISEHHADIIDVSVCSTLDGLEEVIAKRKYNVALIDAMLIEHVKTERIHLPLLLYSENETGMTSPDRCGIINKYQRISSIISTVLERYAKISKYAESFESNQANITAVWSPAGGVGKTSVSIAYALSIVNNDSIIEGKNVFYLNLEDFSSTPGYFKENGKSISSIFEMLESRDGNVEMLIQGISNHNCGITFLSSPDNYDDMCVLSSENVHDLVLNCAKFTDELIIDLSSVCDHKVRKVFEIANKILIVTGGLCTAEAKLAQFIVQNNVYESIKEKVVFIANKDAVVNKAKIDTVVSLPLVQSDDALSVCSSLSKHFPKEWS